MVAFVVGISLKMKDAPKAGNVFDKVSLLDAHYSSSDRITLKKAF